MVTTTQDDQDEYRKYLNTVRAAVNSVKGRIEADVLDVDEIDGPTPDEVSSSRRGSSGDMSEVVGELRALVDRVAGLERRLDPKASLAGVSAVADAVRSDITQRVAALEGMLRTTLDQHLNRLTASVGGDLGQLIAAQKDSGELLYTVASDQRVEEVVAGLAVATAQLTDLRTALQGLAQGLTAVSAQVGATSTDLSEAFAVLQGSTSAALEAQQVMVRAGLETTVGELGGLVRRGIASTTEKVEQHLAQLRAELPDHHAAIATALQATLAELSKANGEALAQTRLEMAQQQAASAHALQQAVAARLEREATERRSELQELVDLIGGRLDAVDNARRAQAVAETTARREDAAVLRDELLAQHSTLGALVQNALETATTANAAALEQASASVREQLGDAASTSVAQHQALAESLRLVLAAWSEQEVESRQADLLSHHRTLTALVRDQLAQAAAESAAVLEGAATAWQERQQVTVTEAVGAALGSTDERLAEARAALLVQQAGLAEAVRVALAEAAEARRADDAVLIDRHAAVVDVVQRALVEAAEGRRNDAEAERIVVARQLEPLPEVVRAAVAAAVQEADATRLEDIAGILGPAAADTQGRVAAQLRASHDALVGSQETLIASLRDEILDLLRDRDEARPDDVLPAIRASLEEFEAARVAAIESDGATRREEATALRSELLSQLTGIRSTLSGMLDGISEQSQEPRADVEALASRLTEVHADLQTDLATTRTQLLERFQQSLDAVVDAEANARQGDVAGLEQIVDQAAQGLAAASREALDAQRTELLSAVAGIEAALAAVAATAERAAEAAEHRPPDLTPEALVALRAEVAAATAGIDRLVTGTEARNTETADLRDRLAALQGDLTGQVQRVIAEAVEGSTSSSQEALAAQRAELLDAVGALEASLAANTDSLATGTRRSEEMIGRLRTELDQALAALSTLVERAAEAAEHRQPDPTPEEVAALREEVSESLSRLDGRVAGVLGRLDSLVAGTETSTGDVAEVQHRITDLNDRIAAMQRHLAGLPELGGLAEQVERVVADAVRGAATSSQEAIDAQRSELLAAVAAIETSLAGRVESFAAGTRRSEQKIDGLRTELDQALASLATAVERAALAAEHREPDTTPDELAALRIEVAGAAARLDDLVTGNRSSSKDVAELRTDLAATRAALSAEVQDTLQEALHELARAEAQARSADTAALQRLVTEAAQASATASRTAIDAHREALVDAVAALDAKLAATAESLTTGVTSSETRIERLRADLERSLRSLASTIAVRHETDATANEQELITLRAEVGQATARLEQLVLETATEEARARAAAFRVTEEGLEELANGLSYVVRLQQELGQSLDGARALGVGATERRS